MVATNTPYRPFLDVEVVRRYSKIDTTHWLVATFFNWAFIAGAVLICSLWPYWPVYIVAIIIIGSRQHGLGVLMHEGVHYRVASNHFWNDFLADYLTGYAILTPTEGYRAFHLKHHQLLDTAEDPERITIDRFEKEWTFPMPRRRLFWFLLRDLSGLWPKPLFVLLVLIWTIPGRRTRHIIRITILYGIVLFVVAMTGHFWTYILLWWVPLLTVFPAGFRLRTSAEHSGFMADERRYAREEVDVVGTTRTTVGNVITQFLFSPYNINYHIEHHLYASVPYFNLPKIHKLLMANPEFVSRSHTVKSYRHAINEITRTEGIVDT